MKAHQLDENNTIINTIEVDSLDVFPSLIDASNGGSIGDIMREDGTFESPPPVELSKEEHNAAIIAQLVIIDSKTIRALRENNVDRLAELDAQAALLRPELK